LECFLQASQPGVWCLKIHRMLEDPADWWCGVMSEKSHKKF